MRNTDTITPRKVFVQKFLDTQRPPRKVHGCPEFTQEMLSEIIYDEDMRHYFESRVHLSVPQIQKRMLLFCETYYLQKHQLAEKMKTMKKKYIQLLSESTSDSNSDLN